MSTVFPSLIHFWPWTKGEREIAWVIFQTSSQFDIGEVRIQNCLVEIITSWQSNAKMAIYHPYCKWGSIEMEDFKFTLCVSHVGFTKCSAV